MNALTLRHAHTMPAILCQRRRERRNEVPRVFSRPGWWREAFCQMAKLLALGEFTSKFKKNRGSRHPPLRSI